MINDNNRHPKIVYMGTPDFAVSPLKSLIESGYNVVGVVTNQDKPSGRGLKITESPVKQYITSLERDSTKEIPKILQPESLKDPLFLSELRSLDADIFVVVAFRMLPKEVWGMPKIATFNLHTSLLPQYRGAAPINWAIINGETVSGVTTFVIDEHIDTGEILLQEKCPVEANETAGTLHDKLMKIGSEIVISSVNLLSSGSFQLTPQSRKGEVESRLKAAPKLTKELSLINWHNDPISIERLIRGLSPFPTAFTKITPLSAEREEEGTVLKIYNANSIQSAHSYLPGTIISDNRSYLKVACNGGFVEIIDLQLSGKKRMGCCDFLKGFRNINDYLLK